MQIHVCQVHSRKLIHQHTSTPPPSKKRSSKRGKLNKQRIHIVIKMKYSLVRSIICKLVIAQVQMRSPIVEGCSRVYVCTQPPSISQGSKWCYEQPQLLGGIFATCYGQLSMLCLKFPYECCFFLIGVTCLNELTTDSAPPPNLLPPLKELRLTLELPIDSK